MTDYKTDRLSSFVVSPVLLPSPYKLLPSPCKLLPIPMCQDIVSTSSLARQGTPLLLGPVLLRSPCKLLLIHCLIPYRLHQSPCKALPSLSPSYCFNTSPHSKLLLIP